MKMAIGKLHRKADKKTTPIFGHFTKLQIKMLFLQHTQIYIYILILLPTLRCWMSMELPKHMPLPLPFLSSRSNLTTSLLIMY